MNCNKTALLMLMSTDVDFSGGSRGVTVTDAVGLELRKYSANSEIAWRAITVSCTNNFFWQILQDRQVENSEVITENEKLTQNLHKTGTAQPWN